MAEAKGRERQGALPLVGWAGLVAALVEGGEFELCFAAVEEFVGYEEDVFEYEDLALEAVFV